MGSSGLFSRTLRRRTGGGSSKSSGQKVRIPNVTTEGMHNCEQHAPQMVHMMPFAVTCKYDPGLQYEYCKRKCTHDERSDVVESARTRAAVRSSYSYVPMRLRRGPAIVAFLGRCTWVPRPAGPGELDTGRTSVLAIACF